MHRQLACGILLVLLAPGLALGQEEPAWCAETEGRCPDAEGPGLEIRLDDRFLLPGSRTFRVVASGNETIAFTLSVQTDLVANLSDVEGNATPFFGAPFTVRLDRREDTKEGNHTVRVIAQSVVDPTMRAEIAFNVSTDELPRPFVRPTIERPVTFAEQLASSLRTRAVGGPLRGSPGERVPFAIDILYNGSVPATVYLTFDPVDAGKAVLAERVKPDGADLSNGPAGGIVTLFDTGIALAPNESQRIAAVAYVPRDALPNDTIEIAWNVTVLGPFGQGIRGVTVLTVVEPDVVDPPRAPLVLGLVALGAAGVGGAMYAGRRRSEAWRYGLGLLLAPLYTRLEKSDVLGHEARKQLHELVSLQPGITYTELQKATGLATGALVHHTRTLERHQLVTSRREGASRRYYVAGARLPTPVPVQGSALTPMQARILALLDGGAKTQREIAVGLGLTQQGASYHLKNLERAGEVATRFQDGSWRYVRVRKLEQA